MAGIYGPGIGITWGQLAMPQVRGRVLIGVPFLIGLRTVASTTDYDLFDANGAPFPFRITRAWGHMLGAAGAGDTVLLQRVSAGTTTSISDTVDLGAAALADQDTFDFAQLNDAAWLIQPGDGLQVTSASDALTELYLLCVRSSVATT